MLILIFIFFFLDVNTKATTNPCSTISDTTADTAVSLAVTSTASVTATNTTTTSPLITTSSTIAAGTLSSTDESLTIVVSTPTTTTTASSPSNNLMNNNNKNEKGLPKAMIKPSILTHVIGDFVIQESKDPFPVTRQRYADDSEPPSKYFSLFTYLRNEIKTERKKLILIVINFIFVSQKSVYLLRIIQICHHVKIVVN